MEETRRIWYKPNVKYWLAGDAVFKTELRPKHNIKTKFIDLGTDGWMTVREGFAWDGPSGPTADTPDVIRGSLMHDAAYELMRQGLLDTEGDRQLADAELKRIMLDDGAAPGRSQIWYDMLRKFGAKNAIPEYAKAPICAPR